MALENGDDTVKAPLSGEEIQKLLRIISGVDYGSVILIIRDGKIVQIEKNEKVRLK